MMAFCARCLRRMEFIYLGDGMAQIEHGLIVVPAYACTVCGWDYVAAEANQARIRLAAEGGSGGR